MSFAQETISPKLLKTSSLLEENLIRIITLLMIGYIYLTRGYWIGNDLILFLPMHESLSHVPVFVQKLVALLTVASLVLLLIKPAQWEFKLVVFLVLAVACALNINRLQPVFITYVWILFATNHQKDFERWGLRLALGAFILFTGLNQLHPSFIENELPTLLLLLGVPENAGLTQALGQYLPYFEIVLGASLLVPNRTVLSIASVVAACYFVILTFVIVGLGQYSFGAYCVALTITSIYVVWSAYAIPPLWEVNYIQAPVITSVVFACIPTLGYIGVMDKHLSFEVFSGNSYNAAVILPYTVWERLPEDVKALGFSVDLLETTTKEEQEKIAADTTNRSDRFLDINTLLINQVSSIPYRSHTTYKRLGAHFKNYTQRKENYVVIVRNGNTFTEGVDTWVYTDLDL